MAMTKDDIIRMAREAGIGWLERAEGITEFLERFAALVAAAERGDKQLKAVPLHERLGEIPADIRFGVKDGDDWRAGTTWYPIGEMCQQAAAELRRLHEVNAKLIHIFRQIRFEQGFACECGIEEATWDLIDAALGEINEGS